MTLNDNDTIVTAWAEACSGLGWTYTVIWVLIRDRDDRLRIDCLQSDEQTKEIRILFEISALASEKMTRIVSVLTRTGE